VQCCSLSAHPHKIIISLQKVKETLTSWKGIFLIVASNIEASGGGDGDHRPSTVCGFVKSARGKEVAAHGDATVYAYI
jgi:hypothetical protein